MKRDYLQFVQNVLNVFERFIVLTTGITLVVAMLYVAGNYQDFSSDTQRFLVDAAQAVAGFTVTAAVAASVGEVGIIALRRRWERVRRVVLICGALIIAGSILVGSSAIIVLQQPL